jgi:spermidine synthase/MFS family permease
VWLSCLLAFISSASTLIIELIAGRIMAPYVGVSLYTWTSIIGVVLAGMSAGNFVGGLVADRYASRRTLGLTFIAGSVASLGILITTSMIVGATFELPLLARIIFYTTSIFFLPSLVLGMVSPLVVKLALANLDRTGNVVGTIYAFSTAGSIFGTFLTGFWLISWLGTRNIVWLVAALLLATGLAVGDFHKTRQGRAALAASGLALVAAYWLGTHGFSLPVGPATAMILFGLVILGPPVILVSGILSARATLVGVALATVTFASVRLQWGTGDYQAPCDVESNYYCIKILETTEGGEPARVLMLDHLVHSFVVLNDPTALTYGYERAYSDITRASSGEQMDTLFIGGGGFTFPRYIEAQYPNSTVDVVEIDPAVIRTAYERLGLPSTSRIRAFNQDARVFLNEWTDPKQYDVIYGDAFNDLSVPYHLATIEFNRILARRLKPNGIYLANVIDKFEGGEFLKADANALRAVFPHVYIFGRGDDFRPFDRNTYVLMASRKPLDRDRLETVTSEEFPTARTTPLPDDRLNAYLRSGRAITLTDDFAPVDQLLARLFLERGN